jgi:hypothetical protein
MSDATDNLKIFSSCGYPMYQFIIEKSI